MTDFERLAESLSFMLDDLGITDTLRISGDELRTREADGLPPVFSAICSDLLRKLSHYDPAIRVVPEDASVSEIFAAFASREPNFSPQAVNSSAEPELLQYRFIHYLCTHLQGERLMLRSGTGTQRLESAGQRGKIVFQLDKICSDLCVEPQQEAPDEMDIISAITAKVQEVLEGMSRGLLLAPPKAISSSSSSSGSGGDAGVVAVSAEQRALLTEVESAYHRDFLLRRRMLMTRLDVTIQSFLWGEAAHGKEGEIVAAIQAQRQHLSEEPPRYTVDDALHAPVSLLHEHSKRVVDTSGRSLVKTVIIGSVPDRGGRANEMRPKKSDLFGFGGGGGGGGRGGGGGGGRGGGGGKTGGGGGGGRGGGRGGGKK